MKNKTWFKIAAFVAFVAATLIFTLTPLKDLQPVERDCPSSAKVALVIYHENEGVLRTSSVDQDVPAPNSTFFVDRTSSELLSQNKTDSNMFLVSTPQSESSSDGFDYEPSDVGGSLIGAVAGINLSDVDNYLSDNSENQQKLLDLESFLKSKGVPLLVICIVGFIYTFVTRSVDLFFDKIATRKRKDESSEG